MAIDTATKRFSIMLDPGEMPYPPDGSFDAADRLFMLEFYSGIASVALKTGPITIAALDTYQFGPKAFDTYQFGPKAFDSYLPGSKAMQGGVQ